jgi:hypothetical protein
LKNFLTKNSDTFRKMAYFFPIALTSCGILIHACGLLGIEYHHNSFLAHLIMLIVDISVVLGLLLKSSWGYWLGILLYIEQVYIQTLSLRQLGWLNSIYRFQIPVPLLCLTALLFLFVYRKEFTKIPVVDSNEQF